MQGIRAVDRKRLIIFIIIPVVLGLALIGLDQITKYFAARDKVNSTVIENFFYLSYSTNSGAGFSFLADKEWALIFFIIITAVALVLFVFFYIFSIKKSYKWLTYSLAFIIAGTIGNYIDRIISFINKYILETEGKGVVDFLSFHFGSYIFPTFNVADVCLTVGVIMLIAHFLFFDENAVFKKKRKTEDGETSEGDTKDDENL